MNKRKLITIAVIGTVAIIWALLFLVFMAKKTVAEVMKLDDEYHIKIKTTWRLWMPISPEGPFPKQSETSFFGTHGNGEITPSGIKFIIGKDVVSKYEQYKEGTIEFSKDKTRLSICAKLSKEYESLTNHSGEYEIKINEPRN